MDIFSPIRELNLLMEVFIAIIIIFSTKRFSILRKYKSISIMLFTIIYLVISQFDMESIKYFVVVFFFLAVIAAVYSIKLNDLAITLKRVSIFSLVCIYLNLILSIGLGLYSQRMVYNFEHVNLFGTYIVFISILFMNSVMLYEKMGMPMSKKRLLIYKLLFVVAAFLTTSTGAFLVQSLIFIPPKYFSLKRIIRLLLICMFGVVFLYYSTDLYLPKLHTKLFGVYDVFQAYSFSEFYTYSINQDSKALTQAMDLGGSFVWRLNTYLFYYHQYFNSGILKILFGGGVATYSDYAYFMPHNDFIALTLDFGILGLSLIIIFLIKNFKRATEKYYYPLLYLVIFICLRLGFENCMYSSYVFSTIITSMGITLACYQIYGSSKKV
uniref:hypothetical protein n=1 Tax=Zhouia sp. PK063 TaxID=3373602 RepID=UPI0037DD8408